MSGLQSAFVLVLGRATVATLTGLHVRDPKVTVLWLLEQAAALVLAAGCAGLLRDSIKWAYVAMWAAFALAGLQGGEAVAQLFTAGTLVLPITAAVYVAFALGVNRSIEAARKATASPRIAQEGA